MHTLVGVLFGLTASSAIWIAVWRRRALDLAHEVRRPMTALILAGEGLRPQLQPGEFDALTHQVQAASLMLDGSDPLSRLLARLRRKHGGSGAGLADVVSSTVAAWTPAARSGGRRIRLLQAVPDLAVRHPGSLTGALSNLIANALEHGSGDVTVSSVSGSNGGWAVEVASGSHRPGA
jgi:signal transduction histidine kinase